MFHLLPLPIWGQSPVLELQCCGSDDAVSALLLLSVHPTPRSLGRLFSDIRTGSDSSFEIYMESVERKYDSVEEQLEGKYKDWQKKLHPDLVHSKSEREREYAAEQSARVIDAYRTLSKPLARAIYILKLEGVDIDEEETLSDLDLLSEIMEIREAVEEAPDSEALNQIQSLMQEKLKQWSNSFAKAFQSRNFEEAVRAIRRMTYYERVNEDIVKKL
ncbi:hypothetical protein M0R45_000070 [Rubus argutus]|uniref:Co-chaperone HscB C-terminal oligomerisation domain-containing protein n=1 Tax=Rubus argutus TaxID=59490 RepID=A0AAW1VP76_RUBAR